MSARTPEKSRKKTSVVRDEVKERHTTHWDVDLLSQAEFDLYMRNQAPWQVQRRRVARRKVAGIIGFGLFLCLLPMLFYWLPRLLGL